jgi:hypothetical protein
MARPQIGHRRYPKIKDLHPRCGAKGHKKTRGSEASRNRNFIKVAAQTEPRGSKKYRGCGSMVTTRKERGGTYGLSAATISPILGFVHVVVLTSIPRPVPSTNPSALHHHPGTICHHLRITKGPQLKLSQQIA